MFWIYKLSVYKPIYRRFFYCVDVSLSVYLCLYGWLYLVFVCFWFYLYFYRWTICSFAKYVSTKFVFSYTGFVRNHVSIKCCIYLPVFVCVPTKRLFVCRVFVCICLYLCVSRVFICICFYLCVSREFVCIGVSPEYLFLFVCLQRICLYFCVSRVFICICVSPSICLYLCVSRIFVCLESVCV